MANKIEENKNFVNFTFVLEILNTNENCAKNSTIRKTNSIGDKI